MNLPIPAPDPIPLPAPVWLMKALGDLTLTVHFIFLHLLIGGLFFAILWNFIGRLFNNKNSISASGVVINRLPIVMTYVINFGVPPLLFVQVLYGQVIYTATILIGLWWISVILAIIIAYFILYRSGYLATEGKSFWLLSLVSLLFILYVGKVYSTAMTFMLKPEDWQTVYNRSDLGEIFPPADPTRLPRYVYMMVASLGFGALLTTIYSSKESLEEGVKIFLRKWGGAFATVFLVFLIPVGLFAWNVQPEQVRQGVMGLAAAQIGSIFWAIGIFLGLICSIWIFLTPRNWGYAKAYLSGTSAVISVAGFVVIRDMVRDVTLASKGFDVWSRAVNTNWVVVGIFFVMLVLGIGLLIWLYRVIRTAKPAAETYV